MPVADARTPARSLFVRLAAHASGLAAVALLTACGGGRAAAPPAPAPAAAPLPTRTTFGGVARDSATRLPLACARVVLEDSARGTAAAAARTRRDGSFTLLAPGPGIYRVRLETPGWAPAYAQEVPPGRGGTGRASWLARFTDQLVTTGPAAADASPVPAMRHAFPVLPGRRAAPPADGGTPRLPTLTVGGPGPAATVWAQFAVDSVGRVDAGTIALTPAGTRARQTAARRALAAVRFTPAREGARPVCELLRMPLRFGAR